MALLGDVRAAGRPVLGRLRGERRPMRAAVGTPAPRRDGFENRRLAVPLERGTFLEPGAQERCGVVVHHPRLAELMRSSYRPQDVADLKAVLNQMGTLHVETHPNGLPQAAELGPGSQAARLGYDAVWTRDAVLIAKTWRETGAQDKAKRALQALWAFLGTPSQRERILSGVNAAAAGDVAWAKQMRPHIRFDGRNLKELDQPWGHHQNDALGLLLEETFVQARAGLLTLDDHALASAALLAAYLRGVDFTTDRELGHWEEAGEQGGKVSSSSLRCVLAGLQEMKRWADEDPSRRARLQQVFEAQVGQHARTFMDFASGASLEGLISRGAATLKAILPLESEGTGIYRRPADLALTTALLLDAEAHPQDRLISMSLRQDILHRLRSQLRGSHGDARYRGDGYWGAYDETVEPGKVERMNHASLEQRLAGGMKDHGEAQWTLGASILSVIWGRLYQQSGRREYLEQQTFELNRALGMVTGPLSVLGPGTIPESYIHVRASSLDHGQKSQWTFFENGLPLNWAKANLALAMETMAQSLEHAPRKLH